jgi:hypothetical protein
MSLEERLDSLALNLEMLKRDVDLVESRVRRRAERIARLRTAAGELWSGSSQLRDATMRLYAGSIHLCEHTVDLRRSSELSPAARPDPSRSRNPGQSGEWDFAQHTAASEQTWPDRHHGSHMRAMRRRRDVEGPRSEQPVV